VPAVFSIANHGISDMQPHDTLPCGANDYSETCVTKVVDLVTKVVDLASHYFLLP